MEQLFRNIDDIKSIESVPLEERISTRSTYEMILRAETIEDYSTRLAFPGSEYGHLAGK